MRPLDELSWSVFPVLLHLYLTLYIKVLVSVYAREAVACTIRAITWSARLSRQTVCDVRDRIVCPSVVVVAGDIEIQTGSYSIQIVFYCFLSPRFESVYDIECRISTIRILDYTTSKSNI